MNPGFALEHVNHSIFLAVDHFNRNTSKPFYSALEIELFIFENSFCYSYFYEGFSELFKHQIDRGSNFLDYLWKIKLSSAFTKQSAGSVDENIPHI